MEAGQGGLPHIVPDGGELMEDVALQWAHSKVQDIVDETVFIYHRSLQSANV